MNLHHTRLLFPSFDITMLSQSNRNVFSDTGRIKILLTEGIYKSDQFHPLRNIICFTFQPAPLCKSQSPNVKLLRKQLIIQKTLAHLQKCNISWPSTTHQTLPQINTQENNSGRISIIERSYDLHETNHRNAANLDDLGLAHCRTPSSSSSASWSGLITQQKTRLPLSVYNSRQQVKIGPTFEQKSSTIRIPSEQIKQIINEITTQTMKLAYTVNASSGNIKDNNSDDKPVIMSRDCSSSDITMHSSCTRFPSCININPLTGILTHESSTRSMKPVSGCTFWDRPSIEITTASLTADEMIDDNGTRIGSHRKRTHSSLSECSGHERHTMPAAKRTF